MSDRRGITLMELLLAIGVIVVLGVIVFIAINPAQKRQDLHNAQRRADVVTILTMAYQYAFEHGGELPKVIPTDAPKGICVTKAASCNNGVSLDMILGPAMLQIPVDPQATGTGSSYTIVKDKTGRLTVAAPLAENDTITFTR